MAHPPPPSGEAHRVTSPTRARTGKYCLDEPDAKIFLSQTLGGTINPLGTEHQLALSLCMPFTRTPGILFDFTNIEVGLVNYLSPVYDHQGAFVSITPLSFLRLRAEVTGLGVWTIPIEGAGFYGFKSYDDDFSEDTRKKREGTTATGSVVGLSATLQGKVPLPRGAGILFVDNFLGELWTLGDEPFYYNSRRDVLLARSDWVTRNTGLIAAEIPINENINVRVGITDEMTFVPRSGYANNILAGVATLLVKRIGATIRNFQPIFRAGGFTQHASSTKFRSGEVNLLLGINVMYDLKTIESDESGGAPAGR